MRASVIATDGGLLGKDAWGVVRALCALCGGPLGSGAVGRLSADGLRVEQPPCPRCLVDHVERCRDGAECKALAMMRGAR